MWHKFPIISKKVKVAKAWDQGVEQLLGNFNNKVSKDIKIYTADSEIHSGERM